MQSSPPQSACSAARMPSTPRFMRTRDRSRKTSMPTNLTFAARACGYGPICRRPGRRSRPSDKPANGASRSVPGSITPARSGPPFAPDRAARPPDRRAHPGKPAVRSGGGARRLAVVRTLGPAAPAVLLGEPPDLGSLCRRPIASLLWLAPHTLESGLWRRERPFRGARSAQGPRSPPHRRPVRDTTHPGADRPARIPRAPRERRRAPF